MSSSTNQESGKGFRTKAFGSSKNLSAADRGVGAHLLESIILFNFSFELLGWINSKTEEPGYYFASFLRMDLEVRNFILLFSTFAI